MCRCRAETQLQSPAVPKFALSRWPSFQGFSNYLERNQKFVVVKNTFQVCVKMCVSLPQGYYRLVVDDDDEFRFFDLFIGLFYLRVIVY